MSILKDWNWLWIAYVSSFILFLFVAAYYCGWLHVPQRFRRKRKGEWIKATDQNIANYELWLYTAFSPEQFKKWVQFERDRGVTLHIYIKDPKTRRREVLKKRLERLMRWQN